MDNELQHHGVLGMRWRWHKSKPKSKPTPIKFHKQHELLNRDIRTLSNQELMDLRDRKKLLNEINQKPTKSFDQKHKRLLNASQYIQTIGKTTASAVAIIKAIEYLNSRNQSNKSNNRGTKK